MLKISEEMKISEQTLCKWKKQSNFIKEFNRQRDIFLDESIELAEKGAKRLPELAVIALTELLTDPVLRQSNKGVKAILAVVSGSKILENTPTPPSHAVRISFGALNPKIKEIE
jgi:hypothetical protein